MDSTTIGDPLLVERSQYADDDGTEVASFAG